MRDTRIGQRHAVGDLAAQADNLDLLDIRFARQRRFGTLWRRPCPEHCIQITMFNTPPRTGAPQLAQVDPGIAGTFAHRRRGQHIAAFDTGGHHLGKNDRFCLW